MATFRVTYSFDVQFDDHTPMLEAAFHQQRTAALGDPTIDPDSLADYLDEVGSTPTVALSMLLQQSLGRATMAVPGGIVRDEHISVEQLEGLAD